MQRRCVVSVEYGAKTRDLPWPLRRMVNPAWRRRESAAELQRGADPERLELGARDPLVGHLGADRQDPPEVDHETAATEESEAGLARIREAAGADSADKERRQRSDGQCDTERRHGRPDETAREDI